MRAVRDSFRRFFRIGTKEWIVETGREKNGGMFFFLYLAQRTILGFGLIILGLLLALVANRILPSARLEGFLIIGPLILGLYFVVSRFWSQSGHNESRRTFENETNDDSDRWEKNK